MAYAENTSVSIGRSRDEIEATAIKYGADQVAYYTSAKTAMVVFVHRGRQIRFALDLPASLDFTRTPTGRPRSAAESTKAHDQAVRSRWRSLAMVIKAKFEAVESGIVTFEQEFAMHMVMADGRTVSDHLVPQLDSALASGQLQIEMRPGGGS